MKGYEILKRIPKDGFLKVGEVQKQPLASDKKTALNRKGNELFNTGNLDKAKRIFLTTGYTDGIIRLGDYYYNNKQVLEAFRMYCLAPAPDKKEILIERMASVIQYWLKNDERK